MVAAESVAGLVHLVTTLQLRLLVTRVLAMNIEVIKVQT